MVADGPGEAPVPGAVQCLVLPVPAATRTPSGVLLIADPTDPALDDNGIRERLADQVGLALLVSMSLDQEVELTHRHRELQQIQSDFVAAASHELRTPLPALLGFTQTLRERGDVLDGAMRSRLLDAMTRQGDRLLRLIEDTRLISVLDDRALVVDLQPVRVRGVAEDASRAFGDADIVPAGPGSTSALADRERLVQLLLYLLDNALTHGAEPVTILWAAELDGVTIEVVDSGKGPTVRAGARVRAIRATPRRRAPLRWNRPPPVDRSCPRARHGWGPRRR